jgi:hypothetical protein
MWWQHSQIEQGLNILYNEKRTSQPSNGSAVQFDGLSNYIQFNDFLFQNNDYTVEFWIKDFDSQIGNFNGYNYIWYCYYTRLSIYQANAFDFVTMTPDGRFNDFNVAFASVPGFNPANWTQIVLRFALEGLTKEVLINGTQVASTTLSQAGRGNIGLMSLGTAKTPWSSPVGYYKGKFTQFRIYTRKLADAEIQYSYNSGNGNSPYSMDQLAVWITFDNNNAHNFGYLGSQYSGQLINFVPSEFISR